MQFVNSTTGYLDAGNSLLKTTDAGITWNYVNPNLGFFCVALNFADSLNGYFSDFTNVLITHDGGISFSQLYNFPNTYNFATKDSFCIAANDLGNVAYTADGGLTWQTEITGINWIAPERYKIVVTPGKHCFLFSQFCGEIRKNELSTAVKGDTYIDNPILIYPNPASAKITIEFPFTPKNGTVTFFGSTGQIAGTIVLDDDEQKVEINIQNFSPGLYLWKFMEYGNVFTGKFIIQH